MILKRAISFQVMSHNLLSSISAMLFRMAFDQGVIIYYVGAAGDLFVVLLKKAEHLLPRFYCDLVGQDSRCRWCVTYLPRRKLWSQIV